MTWTDERRAKHRAALQTWKPWTRSTGPRTAEGKQRSSMNALKHGGHTLEARQFAAALRQHSQWLKLAQAQIRQTFSARTNYWKTLSSQLQNDLSRVQKDFCGSNSDAHMLYSEMKEPCL